MAWGAFPSEKYWNCNKGGRKWNTLNNKCGRTFVCAIQILSLQKYTPIIVAHSFSCVRFILWCSSQAGFKVISNRSLINSQLEHLTTAPQPPRLLSPPVDRLGANKKNRQIHLFLTKKKSLSWSREAVSRMHTETARLDVVRWGKLLMSKARRYQKVSLKRK